MEKIKIITINNPTNAYTTMKYLTQNIECAKLLAFIPREKKYNDIKLENIHELWIGKIPKARFFLYGIKIFFDELFSDNIIILNDLFYFPVFVLIKKMNPNKKIIHYCTEYFDETFLPKPKFVYSMYKKHYNIFDLTIECENKRLEKRVKDFNIHTETSVILNTLPLSLVQEYEANKYDLYEVAQIKPTNKPILVYTGAGSLGRNLNFIIDAIANVSQPINFVAFCYGSQTDLQLLRNYCQQKLGSKHDFKICDAITKDVLLSITGQANAGICYYNPEESTNNNLAAPSKVYEYISQGLPVVCSNNPTMKELFTTYPLGVCAENNSNEAMTKAIETVLFDQELITEIKSKNKQIFAEKLCFEEASKDAIEKILKVADK